MIDDYSTWFWRDVIANDSSWLLMIICDGILWHTYRCLRSIAHNCTWLCMFAHDYTWLDMIPCDLYPLFCRGPISQHTYIILIPKFQLHETSLWLARVTPPVILAEKVQECYLTILAVNLHQNQSCSLPNLSGNEKKKFQCGI